MRALACTVLMVVSALTALAEESQFAGAVKASLVFREELAPTGRYPHVLNVYLRLENISDSGLTWTANARNGLEAELLNAAGEPVRENPGAASIASNQNTLLLPYGSRLDLLISHGGISMFWDNPKDKYALMVGGRGWLVPVETIGSYKLRVRLRGWRGISLGKQFDPQVPDVLFDVPPTSIELAK